MEPIETLDYNGYTIQVNYDQWADNPAEWGNYTLVQFRDNDFDSYADIDDYLTDNGKLRPEVQAKLRAGKMFTIDYSRYSGTDGGFYRFDGSIPSGEVDSRDVNGFIIFDDAYIKGVSFDDRKNYAIGDLATYTAWANGEVYSVDILADGDYIDGFSGYYGYDSIEHGINEAKSDIDRMSAYRKPINASAIHI